MRVESPSRSDIKPDTRHALAHLTQHPGPAQPTTTPSATNPPAPPTHQRPQLRPHTPPNAPARPHTPAQRPPGPKPSMPQTRRWIQAKSTPGSPKST